MTHCAERGGNEAAGVMACYTHGSKSTLLGAVHTRRKEGAMEKVSGGGGGGLGGGTKADKGRESGSDASFIE